MTSRPSSLHAFAGMTVEVNPEKLPGVWVRIDGEIRGLGRYVPPLGLCNANPLNAGLTDEQWSEAHRRVRQYMRAETQGAK